MTERLIAGRYRLLEPLGVGGMSSVWEAEDLELGRRVAVKVLARDADRTRFEREARAAASLTHPNVAQLYDFGETDDGLFMVLELLSGGTLEERLGDGPLPDAETERIALALASGLAAAHAAGIVHRDLKPANVLFDTEGTAKLADLGIARFGDAGTLTEAGTVLGTAAYISPEQAHGERAGPASDVYSFGVVLFRMLTGRLPFESSEAMALVTAHATQPPPPVAAIRPDAPPELAAVADAALAKDPAARPADGAALLAELRGVAATHHLSAAGATAVVSAATPGRGRRARAVAVLSAALVLATAGVGLAWVASRDGAGQTPPTTESPAPSLPQTTAQEPEEPTPPPPDTTEPTTTEPATTAPATTEEPPPATTDELPPTTIETETEPPATLPDGVTVDELGNTTTARP